MIDRTSSDYWELAIVNVSRGYLQTSHWTDAVTSLEAAHEFVERITVAPHYWKWLIVAVHSAVQGFMALALEQGNSLLVMTDDRRVKWLRAHEKGEEPYPDDRMDAFLSLYEKVKSDDVCRYVGSRKFVPGATHDESMQKLNDLRNNFIHFFPKAWSIELAGLPTICLDCLEIAGFLGWDSMTIIWHEAELSDRGRNAVTALKAGLGKLSSPSTATAQSHAIDC